MQINLNSTLDNLPALSPIFGQTPMLSPFPQQALRKYSYNYDEFANFKLEDYEDEDYLLSNIQEIPFECQYDQDQKEEQSEINEQLIVNYEVTYTIQKEKESLMGQNQQQIQSIKDQQKQSIQEERFHGQISPSFENLIKYLIVNINKDDNILKKEALQFLHQKHIYQEIISLLIKKFKKSKKTKQQMVKYCMRKAFKFIADKMKKDRTHNRDIDSCMKIYFSKSQVSSSFSIPFKKNSTQKTMNGSFLKRVFGSDNFLSDYMEFLHEFQQLIEEDNYKKVKYLADFIGQHVKSGQFKKIQTVKRLPWTQETLDQTLQLSQTLVEYAEKQSLSSNAKTTLDE